MRVVPTSPPRGEWFLHVLPRREADVSAGKGGQRGWWVRLWLGLLCLLRESPSGQDAVIGLHHAVGGLNYVR